MLATSFPEYLIRPSNTILALDTDISALSLSPLQHNLGLAQPQVETRKDAEERKQEEARQKAHGAVILTWNSHWKSISNEKKWDTIVSPSEV